MKTPRREKPALFSFFSRAVFHAVTQLTELYLLVVSVTFKKLHHCHFSFTDVFILTVNSKHAESVVQVKIVF